MSASGESNKECSECGGADPHRGDCLTSSEDHYLLLFEERQGIFYVQYPIDRASHIRPLMTLLEHRLTELTTWSMLGPVSRGTGEAEGVEGSSGSGVERCLYFHKTPTSVILHAEQTQYLVQAPAGYWHHGASVLYSVGITCNVMEGYGFV